MTNTIGTLPATLTTAPTLCAECALPGDWCVCGKPLELRACSDTCTFVRRAGVTLAEVTAVRGEWAAFPTRNMSRRAGDALRGRRFASVDNAVDAVRSALG